MTRAVHDCKRGVSIILLEQFLSPTFSPRGPSPFELLPALRNRNAEFAASLPAGGDLSRRPARRIRSFAARSLPRPSRFFRCCAIRSASRARKRSSRWKMNWKRTTTTVSWVRQLRHVANVSSQLYRRVQSAPTMSRLVSAGCTRKLFPVGLGIGKIRETVATNSDLNATKYGLLIATAIRPATVRLTLKSRSSRSHRACLNGVTFNCNCFASRMESESH